MYVAVEYVLKTLLNRKILPETLQMYMYIMSDVLVLTYFKHCLNVHTTSVYELARLQTDVCFYEWNNLNITEKTLHFNG